MSHKQNVRQHCIDHLQSRHLSYCFNETEFERIWRTIKDKLCNPFTCGLSAADVMILNAKPVFYDEGNEE